jgi:rhamnose transport system permease protein
MTRLAKLGGLVRWETLLLGVVVGLVALGASVSPVFASDRNFTNLTAAVVEVAIMALPMTLVIIAAEIDLSVESMAGLACAVLGFLYVGGLPLEAGIPIVIAIGAIGGLFNGLLVTALGLPSLVVTLGTLALFRGLALAILGAQGVSGFPGWFTEFGFGVVPGTPIPWPAVVFIALAVVLGFILHATWLGRQVFATGKNVAAARFSGVRVARTKLLLFVLSGAVAAVAGIILTARFASARADVGQGLTLTVITIVLLGGVNIFGGRGTIPGVVLAAATLAVLGNVLRLTNVSAEIQSIAVGLLLVVSVVLPNFAHQLRSGLGRVAATRPAPSGPNGRGGTGP